LRLNCTCRWVSPPIREADPTAHMAAAAQRAPPAHCLVWHPARRGHTAPLQPLPLRVFLAPPLVLDRRWPHLHGHSPRPTPTPLPVLASSASTAFSAASQMLPARWRLLPVARHRVKRATLSLPLGCRPSPSCFATHLRCRWVLQGDIVRHTCSPTPGAPLQGVTLPVARKHGPAGHAVAHSPS
jgi:hypothetical protein